MYTMITMFMRLITFNSHLGNELFISHIHYLPQIDTCIHGHMIVHMAMKNKEKKSEKEKLNLSFQT